MAALPPKYRILRSDDESEPKWPAFVLGAQDDIAFDALHLYRARAVEMGADPAYVEQIDERIATFTEWRAANPKKLATPAPWKPKKKK